MADGTPYQKIDAVLSSITNDSYDTFQNKGWVTKLEIMATLITRHGHLRFDDAILERILNLLIDEKYIETKQTPHPYISESKQDCYRLLFEGEMLISSGGYDKMVSDRTEEESRVRGLVISQHEQSVKMTNLTRWIAFGTIVLSVYGILQILDWFCCHPHISYWGHLFFSCPK